MAPGGLAAAPSALAEEIAANSPLAVPEAKRAIDAGLDVSVADGIDLEDLAWRRAVATRDRAEGIAAFVEKRDAELVGGVSDLPRAR